MNKLLTLSEVAKKMLNDIEAQAYNLPENSREEFYFQAVDRLSRSLGGPGVAKVRPDRP